MMRVHVCCMILVVVIVCLFVVLTDTRAGIIFSSLAEGMLLALILR